MGLHPATGASIKIAVISVTYGGSTEYLISCAKISMRLGSATSRTIPPRDIDVPGGGTAWASSHRRFAGPSSLPELQCHR
jgi:hypothetical protein